MDRATVLKLQQIEFFLLHGLVVDELRLLKRSRRMTPAKRQGGTAQQRMALIGRLFRSFLEKVFPARVFAISKRPCIQEFTVGMDPDTSALLRRAGTADPDLCRTLQPTVGEIGLLRFDFPHTLTITMGTGRRRRAGYNYRYGCEMDVADMGVGRHCAAARAVLAWKGRLDRVLAAGAVEGMVGPPEPRRNQAQEQLEAVIRGAEEAGRL